ncbi:hypothetical protein [Citrobacter pasteurii]|nr:hypothetical protein [Citrobacter pasteurii]
MKPRFCVMFSRQMQTLQRDVFISDNASQREDIAGESVIF